MNAASGRTQERAALSEVEIVMTNHDGEFEERVSRGGELPVDEAQCRSAQNVLRNRVVVA